MHKKRLWLLVLPILLCGAVFWVADVRSSRLEGELRFALSRQSRPRQGGLAMVGDDVHAVSSLGSLSNADVRKIVAQIKLVSFPTPLSVSSKPLRIFLAMEFAHLTISLDESRKTQTCRVKIGKDGLLGASQQVELTPDSCGAIKSQFFVRWHNKIAAYEHTGKS